MGSRGKQMQSILFEGGMQANLVHRENRRNGTNLFHFGSYNFTPVTTSAAVYMGAVVFIEAGSLAFLSGLIQVNIFCAHTL